MMSRLCAEETVELLDTWFWQKSYYIVAFLVNLSVEPKILIRQPYQWLFCLNNSNCLFEWRPENKTLIRWTAPENIQYLRRPKTSLAGSHGEVRTVSGWRLDIWCKLGETRALLLWHLLNQAGLGFWCKLCDKHFCDSTPFLWFHALFPNWQTICFGLQAIRCSNLSTLHIL